MTKAYTLRSLEVEECEGISEIQADHYIEKAWRDVEGVLTLVPLNYQQIGFPAGLAATQKALVSTLQEGGYVIGAFDQEQRLIAFASLRKDLFGETYTYGLLDLMFVSLPWRGEGLGKALLEDIKNQARQWGADKLYICAGSAADTIAFYKRQGAIMAKEVNQALYEEDPRDLQLEIAL